MIVALFLSLMAGPGRSAMMIACYNPPSWISWTFNIRRIGLFQEIVVNQKIRGCGVMQSFMMTRR
jgi:hypothetical protein